MPVSDPDARISFGIVILCIGALSLFPESIARLGYWMLLIAGFGVGMIVSGAAEKRHDARVRREMERAGREWGELLREAEAAASRGESMVRLLQQRGYHEYFVRRWIAGGLQQELSLRDPEGTPASGPHRGDATPPSS